MNKLIGFIQINIVCQIIVIIIIVDVVVIIII